MVSKFRMELLLQGKIEIIIKSHSTSKVSRRTRLSLKFELFIRCHWYSFGSSFVSVWSMCSGNLVAR